MIEETRLGTCAYCGTHEETDWICPESFNHYICETCRLSIPGDVIETVCKHTSSNDAWEIATLIMKHPVFSQHGVEHHVLVAPVILTALMNNKQIEFDRDSVKGVLKRTADIPPGVCGSRGDCGASVGAGATVSILLKASFKSGKERSLVMKTTANAMLKLAKMGGGRCCKQSVYAAIETCKDILKQELNLELVIGRNTCSFSGLIADCKMKECPYYEQK